MGCLQFFTMAEEKHSSASVTSPHIVSPSYLTASTMWTVFDFWDFHHASVISIMYSHTDGVGPGANFSQ